MNGPAVAWRDIAAKLQPYVARRVPASDVDDVLQDVLLRMHRGLGGLRDDDRMTAWIFQIARAAIAERGRDRARHPVVVLPTTIDAATEPSDDERPAADALAACLTVFIARLRSPYREAVTLVELEGMSTRAAADLVGVSVSGMKSRIQRGRAQLREMLEACCEIAVDVRGCVTDFTPRAAATCCPSAQRRG